MDDDQVAKLFEPFVQGDDSATRKYQGAGLGLAIAKRLSVLLGGDIKVTRKLGAGSTFALVVPAT
jgi:signal transduction histidine kinase